MPRWTKVSWPILSHKKSYVPPVMLRIDKPAHSVRATLRYPWATMLENPELPQFEVRLTAAGAICEGFRPMHYGGIPVWMLRMVHNQDEFSWYWPDLEKDMRPRLLLALRLWGRDNEHMRFFAEALDLRNGQGYN